MHVRPSRSKRTLAVALLVVLQFILQPAAVLAAVTGASGSPGFGADCAGCCSPDSTPACCSAPAPAAMDCCCCDSDATPTESAPKGPTVHSQCSCATMPAPLPVVPGETFEGTAAASAHEFVDPRTPLPGIIEVERFGVHGRARARAPGSSRSLNELHRVYRI